MKNTKKLMAMFLAVCMTLSLVCTSVFAAEVPTEELPDGATIVYQDDEITVIESDVPFGGEGGIAPLNELTYESTWINGSTGGRFPIYTPNTNTWVTLAIESSSNDSCAYIQILNSNMNLVYGDVYVDNAHNNKYFQISGNPGTYYVNYMAYTSVGMRIMCWMH